jgi:hypothetical protein
MNDNIPADFEQNFYLPNEDVFTAFLNAGGGNEKLDSL